MRKHLYLITEHEEKERVGRMKFMDQKLSRPDKNNEAAITVMDTEKEGFRDVGKQVCVGYHDFESEDKYNDPDVALEVMHNKLAEIDQKWLDKAGVDLE